MYSMREATITFPMLGDWFSINPSATFTIFGMTLYWYGAIIALGFLLAVIYCFKRSPQFGITNDNLIDLLICAVPIGVIGARLYYVAFNFADYKDNPIDIIKIWEGGLAIYGGIIFAVLTAAVFCKVKKISLGAILDVSAYGLLIGQAVGRWGNFMNREAFGAETTVPWRMGLTPPYMNTFYVHPTFLYESLWNILGLIILHFMSKKGRRKYDGQIFISYVAWYGLGRLFIEGLRTDSLYLFGTNLRVSQLLAGLSLLIALVILIINRFFRKHNPKKLWVNKVSFAEAQNADIASEIPNSDETRNEAAADEEINIAPVAEPNDAILPDNESTSQNTDESENRADI